MSGQDYLQDIKNNLQLGRHQHRMGENLLKAFGYVRRRVTAIDEINATLDELGLKANPPISSDMPLRTPRIIFSLEDETSETAENLTVTEPAVAEEPPQDAEQHDEENEDGDLLEPAFSVSELASANVAVECISPSASIGAAYTTMLLNKYSQLVVANSSRPRQQDIKGIVSFQSIAKALMNGNPTTVGDCLDDEVQFAQNQDDLNSVVNQLNGNDVVLVIGRKNRLQGIVTAWDLAEEFAGLVDPFKKIGEIEERLRTLIGRRLGEDTVGDFLADHGFARQDPTGELEGLTIGELQRVLDYPDHWNVLGLAFDRKIFISGLNDVREYRNRLMHFRDPLNSDELTSLTNFCDTVREIQL